MLAAEGGQRSSPCLCVFFSDYCEGRVRSRPEHSRLPPTTEQHWLEMRLSSFRTTTGVKRDGLWQQMRDEQSCTRSIKVSVLRSWRSGVLHD